MAGFFWQIGNSNGSVTAKVAKADLTAWIWRAHERSDGVRWPQCRVPRAGRVHIRRSTHARSPPPSLPLLPKAPVGSEFRLHAALKSPLHTAPPLCPGAAAVLWLGVTTTAPPLACVAGRRRGSRSTSWRRGYLHPDRGLGRRF